MSSEALGYATTLLADLRHRGIELVAQGDRLRYRPRSAMTPELAEQAKRHKPELLAILRTDARTPPIRPEDLSAQWRERYEERAAIMEYDACMTRADAEESALADILRLMRELGECP